MLCNPFGIALQAQQITWKHYPSFRIDEFFSSGKLNCLASYHQILLLDSLCQKVIWSREKSENYFPRVSKKELKSGSDGSIYILGSKYVYRLDASRIDSIQLPFNASINCFFVDSQGTIWLGTNNSKALYLKKGIWNEFKLEIAFRDHKPMTYYNIELIKQDRTGTMWFVTEHGLTKYDSNFFYTYSSKNGIRVNTIYDFDIDTNGVIYVLNGNYELGIFLSIINGISSVLLPKFNYNQVTVDKENYVWLYSSNGGIPGYLDGKSSVDYIETGYIENFHLDIYGNLNYVLDHEKLIRVTNKGKHISDFNKLGFITNGTYDVCIDSFGTEWVYNYYFLRKLHFDYHKDSIIYFRDGNDRYYINSMKIDANNNFWLAGSYESNIIQFSPYLNQTTFYKFEEGQPQILLNSRNKIFLYKGSELFELIDTLISIIDLSPCVFPFIYKAVINSKDIMYLMSSDKLFIWDGTDCEEISTPVGKNSYTRFKRLWTSRNDEIYLLLESYDTLNYESEHYYLNFKNNKFHALHLPNNINSISALTIAPNDDMWISYGDGILKIDSVGIITDYAATTYPFLKHVSKIVISDTNRKYFISSTGVTELIEEELTNTVEKKLPSIQFYPNPTTGKIFINNPEKIESVEVYNSSGMLVNRISNPGSEMEIKNSGIYYIRAKTSTNKIVEKIFVLEY